MNTKCTLSSSQANDPVEYVNQIKTTMIEAVKSMPNDVDSLISLFLIGSCADNLASDDWYQDYDVHFRFQPIVLRRCTLAWLGELLDRCVALQDDKCKVAASVRDRHWKMVPDQNWTVNVGIHATLLNAADHARRVHYNPILSQNMYVRCLVLWGKHPREMIGFRPSVPADYAHSVGGIAWMVENFTRMVALHIIEPQDRSFYPFVAGYCWNAASTLMFHLGTLEERGIFGRTIAFQRFLNCPRIPNKVREAAERLYEFRETPDTELNQRNHINAAALVVNYVASEALSMTGLYADKVAPPTLGKLRELYSMDVSAALGLIEPLQIIEAVVPDSETDFYGAVEEIVAKSAAIASHPLSVKENFEMLRDALAKETALTRLRLWNQYSSKRRLFSFDFAYERGYPSLDCALFNWEDGAQALLQRFNEVFIEKRATDSELSALGSAISRLLTARLGALGMDVTAIFDTSTLEGDFDAVCNAIGTILHPHVMNFEKL